MKQKILFFGTPEIAAQVLALLQQHHQIVGVVTQPDKPRGRVGHPSPSPVKAFAAEKQLLVLQPEKASESGFVKAIHELQADLFVVVAYGQILRQSVLDVPKIDAINLHASLLPKYRGAAPIQRAILAGETVTGVTAMSMVREMDAGDIYAMRKMAIGADETAGDLGMRMAREGADLLAEVIASLEKGEAQKTPQDSLQATFAPKIEKEESRIVWDRPAEQVHNLIRGLSPNPGAWCIASIAGEKKRIKIYRSSLLPDCTGVPGEMLARDKKGFSIACQTGAVVIREMQPEGKKTMTAEAFVQGLSARCCFL